MSTGNNRRRSMPNYYIKESSDKPCPMRKHLDFGASGFAIITMLMPLFVFFEKKVGTSWGKIGASWGSDWFTENYLQSSIVLLAQRLKWSERHRDDDTSICWDISISIHVCITPSLPLSLRIYPPSYVERYIEMSPHRCVCVYVCGSIHDCRAMSEEIWRHIHLFTLLHI